MLDYEITCYTVEYHQIGAACNSDHVFTTEEAAIKFIKENREKWLDYRLVKTATAIIDF